MLHFGIFSSLNESWIEEPGEPGGGRACNWEHCIVKVTHRFIAMAGCWLGSTGMASMQGSIGSAKLVETEFKQLHWIYACWGCIGA